MNSEMLMSGKMSAKVKRAPTAPLSWKLSNLPNLVKGFWKESIASLFGLPAFFGHLYVRVIKKDGEIVNYGLVSNRVVTTAFVNEMVDQLQTETSTWGDFKYHDSGVGTTGAVVGDTDIETTDGESRVTGSQEEGASANIYKSIGTIGYTTTKAITEHGLFNASTSGILLDRHVFSAINVDNGDSIQFTYELTCTAGG